MSCKLVIFPPWKFNHFKTDQITSCLAYACYLIIEKMKKPSGELGGEASKRRAH